MIKINLDRMARILGVKSPDEYLETLDSFPSDTYGVVFREAKNEGYSDDEAEEKALDAETKERDAAYNKYVNSLVHVFEQEVDNLKLNVEPLKTLPGFYALTPKEGWIASAVKVRSIVHGITGFWFTSFKEFLLSGPYTPRKAVNEHLGHVGEQWKLYGYASPSRRMEAA